MNRFFLIFPQSNRYDELFKENIGKKYNLQTYVTETTQVVNHHQDNNNPRKAAKKSTPLFLVVPPPGIKINAPLGDLAREGLHIILDSSPRPYIGNIRYPNGGPTSATLE